MSSYRRGRCGPGGPRSGKTHELSIRRCNPAMLGSTDNVRGRFNAIDFDRTLSGPAGDRAGRVVMGAERAGALREGYQAAARAEEAHLRQCRAAGRPGLRAERRGGGDTGQPGDRRQGEHGQDPEGDGRGARFRPPEEDRQGRRGAALRQAQARRHDRRRRDVHGAGPLRRAQRAVRCRARLPHRYGGQGARPQDPRGQHARRDQAHAGPGDRRHQRQVGHGRRQGRRQAAQRLTDHRRQRTSGQAADRLCQGGRHQAG